MALIKTLSKILWFILIITYSISVCKSLDVNINPDTISVSGLSSGGYMAGQFHIAHSKHIKGVGIFSAGPYYCAQGELQRAMEDCTVKPEKLDINYLLNKANTFYEMNLIDSLENIQNQNVYIFSGLLDTRVVYQVTDKLEQFYQKLNSNIKYEIIPNSQHAFPTSDLNNNPCHYLGSPFINNCQTNGAEKCIFHLLSKKIQHDSIKIEKLRYKEENLIEIDQSKYFETTEDISMNQIAYVYVPDNCKSNKKVCDLHVAFHGCKQTLNHIGKDFMVKTGYLDVAERNDLIILFPQAKISETSPTNPLGCWDYWGYNEENVEEKFYSTKYGKQISAVWRMIIDLVFHNKDRYSFELN
jgi:hypothetical protein